MSLVEPDLVVYPRDFNMDDVRGPDVLLAIEVADTSFAFDRGRKAQLYVVCGVQDLCVIEANSRTTFVHRGPTKLGWSEVLEIPPDRAFGPLVPGLYQLAVRLLDWD